MKNLRHQFGLTAASLIASLIASLPASILASGAACAATPNDPFFNQQWSLHNDGSQSIMIDVDDLHTLSQKGVAGVDIGWLEALDEIAGLKTSPVSVAVIDSGIDPKHADLQGRISDSGMDFLTGSPNLSDDVGHGTHVSGIIAANASNSVGIAGVAPASVSIMPLRILSKDFTKFSYNGKLISDYAADAIRYAVAHGASVINMSLGWPKVVNTDNVRAAVSDAVQKGVLIVAAAGNDHKDLPTYPCALEGVLCVGAITNTGAMATYSNSGGSVDILAPGDSIISTYPSGVESQILRIQGYEMLNGTSQAAPQIAGIAAALKSVFPNIGLNELKARVLLSGAPLPGSAASLYGLANLKRALDAQPQPVFLPDFKSIEEVSVGEPGLNIQGSLAVQNLWQTATTVHAQIQINGKSAGSAQAATVGSGSQLLVPWSYAFGSLDDSADVHMTVTISAASGMQKTFSFHFSAARAIQNLAAARTVSVPNAGPWINNVFGTLFSALNQVDASPQETGVPRYYIELGSGGAGSTLQLFDPQATPSVMTIQVPMIQNIGQVIRMDVTGSGQRDWVITGQGSNTQGQHFFVFYFLGPDFKPLWGTDTASTWAVNLNTPQAQAIARNYAAPSSWLKSADGKLLPCFLASGALPDPDNFNLLDPRHYKAAMHLFYLNPAAPAAGAASVSLQVRALDNSAFQVAHSGLTLRNPVPVDSAGADAGHLRFLLGMGDGLDAQTMLWDVRSVSDSSIAPVAGWDSLSSSGLAVQAQTSDVAVKLPLYLSFFDPTRGSLAWSTPQGDFVDRTEFSFSSPQNPIVGLIGAFSLPQLGRYWFLETGFDLVAFHQGPQQGLGPVTAPPVETQAIPIERDSTFPGQQFSEMFTPIVVGTDAHPLPGIYIDSTLVRGNRVSIAVWDPASARLQKPLRYSLQIPYGCVQMSPTRLDSRIESFALPLLCGQGTQMELRALQPALQAAQ